MSHWIGVVVIFAIIFTDAIDTIYVLPVLGALCLVYGIFGLLQSRGSNEAGLVQRSMLQLILGAFVIFIGMIDRSTSSESDTEILGYFPDSHCGGHCDLMFLRKRK